MSTGVIASNELCPCGSEVRAKNCCYPQKAPIDMVAPPYVRETVVEAFSPSLDKILYSNAPQLVKELAKTLSSLTLTETYSQKSGPGLLSKEQTNPQIASVLGYAPNGFYLNSNRNEHTLVSPLHSVKYHQQQCMYRVLSLQRQAKRQSRNRRKGQLSAKQVRMVQIVQFEDVPLRVEFEAFASRIASALDAIAKYVCDCIGKNKVKFGKHFSLLNHLQKHEENTPLFVSLKEIYQEYEGWSVSIVDGLRHVVMHEGTLWSLEPAKGISEEVRFIPPSNNEHRIDELCVHHWRTLMNMVASIRQVLIKYQATE